MQFQDLLGSCGMQYVWVASFHPETFASQVLPQLTTNLVVFSDRVAVSGPDGWKPYRNAAQQMADFIEEQKLGTVVRSEWRDNPNHALSTTVQGYIWSVDRKALAEFAKASDAYKKGQLTFNDPYFISMEGRRYENGKPVEPVKTQEVKNDPA